MARQQLNEASATTNEFCLKIYIRNVYHQQETNQGSYAGEQYISGEYQYKSSNA